MAKADCMLAIVWLLRSRGRMTARELSETLEISVRSVYRYVDSLCASGVPVVAESGHDGGYRLLHGDGAPLFFSQEEKTALIHSVLFAQKAGYPFTGALMSAMRKIEYHSTEAQIREMEVHSAGLNVIPSMDHSTYQHTLVELERAIANRQTVSVSYQKPREEVESKREVNPYGLIHWRDRWYVIAHCHLRNEPRTFRVDRIVSCTPTSQTFDRPDGFSATEFFATHQLTTSPRTDLLQRVVLAGERDAIDDLAQHWFLGPRLVSKAPHEALYLIEEETLASYVPHILLPFGRSIRVMEPQSLKRGMAELALSLAAHYQAIH